MSSVSSEDLSQGPSGLETALFLMCSARALWFGDELEGGPDHPRASLHEGPGGSTAHSSRGGGAFGLAPEAALRAHCGCVGQLLQGALKPLALWAGMGSGLGSGCTHRKGAQGRAPGCSRQVLSQGRQPL